MKVIKVTNLNNDIDKYELLKMYKSFFSLISRIPIFIIKKRIKQGKYILTKYLENNKLIGFSIIYKEQNYVLIHYIVVRKEVQGKGYGSKILQNILLENNNLTVFLSCEYFNETNKTQKKKNRYNFYLKNNLINNNFTVKEYFVRYFILSNKVMNQNEYLNVVNNCFNKALAKLFFKIYK